MATADDQDAQMEDDYDEAADSDFNDGGIAADDVSSSSGEEDHPSERPRKRQKVQKPEASEDVVELDSGDEVTIKEHHKARRRQKRKDGGLDEDSGPESTEWRARTRAMREHEQQEKKRDKLATTKGSTIDIDKVWEAMNKPGSSSPPPLETQEENGLDDHFVSPSQRKSVPGGAISYEGSDKENASVKETEEMITIKRQFKFAGEAHIEERIVPKSSAEARLWLAQQSSKPETQTESGAGPEKQRPLRKMSRFDPNYNNAVAFKPNWTAAETTGSAFKGPKLNTVEKSKMDWAVHVDAEGLKDELDVHAKAKEGYLNRMDFLGQVEQHKEVEARNARLRK